MQVQVKVYSKSKQTKAVSKGSAEKVTTIAERVVDTLTYEVKGNLPLKQKLAQIEYFVTRSIGARYKAAVSLAKRLPSVMFFEITLDGRVFRSETALVKANMTNAVAVSFKALTGKDGDTIIAEVAAVQIRGIRTSVAYLNDIAKIAKGAEGVKLVGKELSSLSVMTGGDVVEVEPEPADVVE